MFADLDMIAAIGLAKSSLRKDLLAVQSKRHLMKRKKSPRRAVEEASGEGCHNAKYFSMLTSCALCRCKNCFTLSRSSVVLGIVMVTGHC